MSRRGRRTDSESQGRWRGGNTTDYGGSCSADGWVRESKESSNDPDWEMPSAQPTRADLKENVRLTDGPGARPQRGRPVPEISHKQGRKGGKRKRKEARGRLRAPLQGLREAQHRREGRWHKEVDG